ncbi:unnamed protein product [Hyaloperonospora brassicae]|uniref:Peroxisomal membrane protein PEX14 n=1 Tax=Hyaloperonospora brassicae TaxID=162125 RepID=A0AAV0SXV7_HYABA|nr:unnamed protein product [Hyaloperonospora brassicae]
MREELVENGLKFLQHPSVQSTPLSERATFLEGKGMTKEEIQAAIERHEKSGTAAAPNSLPLQQQQIHSQRAQQAVGLGAMPTSAAVPMMPYRAQYPAYVRVLWTVSSLIGAASIVTFIWNYAVDLGYIPWLRPTPLLLKASAVQEEKENAAKKDEALLAELSSVAAAIQEQTNELAKLTRSLDEKERDLQNKTLLDAHVNSTLREHGNAQSIAELRAEISTLKALLLAKRTKSTSDVDANVKATSEDATRESLSTREATDGSTLVDRQKQQPAVVSHTMQKAERMQTALKKLRTENSLGQLKSAAGILSMYVKNLVENPDVPRYRRIAPGNANFKQKVEPLKHHEELLKSIGFEAAGLNLEWKWHAASKSTGAFDENIAILRALLKALQSLASADACSNLSLEEIAHASLEEFYAQRDQKRTETATMNSTSTNTVSGPAFVEEQCSATQESTTERMFSSSRVSSDPTSTSFNAFMARLEQQTSVSNAVNAGGLESDAIPTSSRVKSRDDEDKMMPDSATNSTVAADGPSYPTSFKEVVACIQKGETVPGIRDIEDKLSVDASALLSDRMKAGEATAAKPWEQLQA